MCECFLQGGPHPCPEPDKCNAYCTFWTHSQREQKRCIPGGSVRGFRTCFHLGCDNASPMSIDHWNLRTRNISPGSLSELLNASCGVVLVRTTTSLRISLKAKLSSHRFHSRKERIVQGDIRTVVLRTGGLSTTAQEIRTRREVPNR